MPRHASAVQSAPAPLDHENEDLSHHPFIELIARWVLEVEAERRAQAKKPRRQWTTAQE